MPPSSVAEDDPLVLEGVTRIVRKAGYHAIPARDGGEAWGDASALHALLTRQGNTSSSSDVS